MNVKKYTMNVLNGAAMGIVIALIPGALLSELLKALSKFVPELSLGVNLLTATNSFVGMAIGISTAVLFQLNTIEMISTGIATLLAGGAVVFTEQGVLLKGTGDVITMAVVAAIAVGIIYFIRPYTKGFAILIVPTVSVVVSAVIGRLLLPYFVFVTTAIGNGVKQLLTLEQTVMCILIAIIFSYLIVSPISSVGVAVAISIAGVGSGAANLGICAAMFALAVAGRRVNTLGVCLAHVIGSPKISMANIVKKPLLLLPISVSAGAVGVAASLLNIQGTPMSAGFGVSGLVGPVAHLNSVGWSISHIIVTLGTFIVLPLILAYIVDYIFVTKLNIIQPEDYLIQL